jgi:hypothetical protein
MMVEDMIKTTMVVVELTRILLLCLSTVWHVLNAETPSSSETKGSDINTKKMQRSFKDVQRNNGVVAAAKKRNSQAMKVATRIIEHNKQVPKNKRKSIVDIVAETNQLYKSTINPKETASRYVRQGMIGTSPMKKGPVGHFTKTVYTALMGAYSSYLKLEQAESKKQSNIKHMSKLVNAVVNLSNLVEVT